MTLRRFYSFHYVLPFVLAGLSLVHIGLLHVEGSNNRLGVKTEKVGFYPYCYVKDMLMLLIMLISLVYLVFVSPNVLGHADGYVEVDTMKTPDHIVPEWYFLLFYAILRGIPDKV